MSLNYEPQTVTAEEYANLFALERQNTYAAVDAVERAMGVAVDRDRLEAAARVLSCPMKAAPPNWQHGRVIYAVTKNYLDAVKVAVGEHVNLLDIGTAKGFSALCLAWAAEDWLATITSVDVLPPSARVRRNTVAEVDSLRTLHEILEPWPEAQQIRFLNSTGIEYLRSVAPDHRIHVAFVDGKHTNDAVYQEGLLLSKHQQREDVVIFDDYQVPGVAAAVNKLRHLYAMEYVAVKPGRTYVIARRQ